ncbi:AraC family transcriptional regulator [Streptomyces bathyalis]|uniref:AraC family transcriptional regulator n=1 Tax=Streptomyces bathyalis TaxID=2710756 RepID=A0A7T1T319_9ACTN|nr:AraC family transcriptional regulator [Streptomyces bathyalis]QPP05464.1 AraC family transcriptional regulator [Streptomyces bathyalis]
MTADAQQPAVEWFDFTTSDPAAAQATTREMYGDCRQTLSSTEDFAFGFHRRSVADIGLDRLAHSATATADCDVFEDLMLFACLTGGRLSVTSSDQEAALNVGDTALYPPGVPIRISWSDMRAEVLSMPLRVAERAAAESCGEDEVRFTGTAPVSPAMDRFWRSTVGFVSHQLETPDSPLSAPLVRAETLDMLGAAVVQVFPNTTMTSHYRPGPGQISPAAVRRAADFIDVHAGRPITLDEIAAEASVSPQELNAAFASRFETTPFGYLRRVRLARAHRELQATDPATEVTVSSIATRWGFPSPEIFAVHYHDVYGQPPDHTLRN